MTNKKNSTKRLIQEGKMISVHDTQGNFLKNKLKIVNDSAINVGEIHLTLEDISRVKRKTTFSKVTGITLMTIGIISLTGGISSYGSSGLNLSPAFILTGLVISTSGITILTVGGKYSNEKWRFSINEKI